MRKFLTRCRPLVLLLACALHGQVTGRIGGYVKDSSGAIIPKAAVKAVVVEQGFTRTTQTDNTGRYELVAIPAATYEIAAEAAGFQRQVQTGVELRVNQDLRLDIELSVGQVHAEVTVSSSATLVNTTSATLSATVDSRRVLDLPLNGRNIVQLAEILPGVTDVSTSELVDNTRSGPMMSVNGSRQIDNNFTFNGANWTNFAQSQGMNYPPPDAIAEVMIQTQQFDSQYGNSVGSQTVVTSKSGTNSFHGSAWEFLRNAHLNARSFFQPVRPLTHENQAGAAAGGPIKRNKLFVFGYYQRLWNRPQASSTSATVPTGAQRNGDFTGLSTTLKNPLNALTNQPMTDSTGRPCVQGKVILAGCLNPAAQNILKAFIPQSETGKVFNQTPTPQDQYSYMGRIDYMQNSRSTFNGHFYVDNLDAIITSGNIQPYELGIRFNQTQAFALSNTYTLTSSLLNEFTVDYMHARSGDSSTKRYLPSTLGVNLPDNGQGLGLSVSVSGYFNLATTNPNVQEYRSHHLRDNMTWVRGRHTMKWGYEAYRGSFKLNSNFERRASTFSGAYSGNALVDFELGVFDTITVNYGFAEANYVNYKHFFFFQDEVKIAPRFTLTLGTRWEPYLATKQKYGQYTSINFDDLTAISRTHPDAVPGTLFEGDQNTPPNGKLNYNDMNNFGPRFGFAWDVFGNGKTSIRGGYGLFFAQLSLNTAHQAKAPWAGSDVLNNGNLSDPYGSLRRQPSPGGTLPGKFGCVKISAFPGYQCAFPLPAQQDTTDQHLVTPYTQSMSLTIERQVGRVFHFQVGYAGKVTQKLEGHRYWNAAVTKPSPRTGAAPSAQNVNDRVNYQQTMGLFDTLSRLLGSDYRAAYHSVQGRVERRFSQGLSAQASYVFSKELDNYNVSGAGLTRGNGNPFNLKADKGRGNFDRTHVFSMSWLWRQEHKFQNSLVNRLMEDWNIGAYHSVQSGAPIFFATGSDIALNGINQNALQHAQLASGMTHEDVGMSHPNRDAFINKYFNTAAFVPLAQMQRGSYGNAGRNFMNGPALKQSNFTLTRGIRVRENLKVQLRGEFFNAFNLVRFDAPNTTVSSGSFGRITGASGGRVIQVATKIVW